MTPDDDKTTPENNALATGDSSSVAPPATDATQAAAANVVRSQIEKIYNHDTSQSEPSTPAGQQDANPYVRVHDEHPQPALEQWQQYHSAWQTYYQRYYEGYYTHHLKKAKDSLESTAEPKSREAIFTHQPEYAEGELTKDEALFDLRQKLLSRVSESAKKVRKSRHFIPITAAVLVVLVFAFLQYNRVLVANVMAYVSPGNIDPQNIVLDPTTDITVSSEPRLIIPKINVDVPVYYDVGNDYDSQMAAMAKGVAHFAIPGASSRPGQVGNTVLSGHSSSDLLDAGDYKFIFAQLDKLAVGDSVYVNYHSKRYSYTVTKKEVVEPNEVNKLVYPTKKPVLTLITCTPLGTALHRLLVTAEQVSPDPSSSAPAPSTTGSNATAEIPGSTPTFFEKLFGGGGN
jgi:sortase A